MKPKYNNEEIREGGGDQKKRSKKTEVDAGEV
jgi:hypothetical protein